MSDKTNTQRITELEDFVAKLESDLDVIMPKYGKALDEHSAELIHAAKTTILSAITLRMLTARVLRLEREVRGEKSEDVSDIPPEMNELMESLVKDIQEEWGI